MKQHALIGIDTGSTHVKAAAFSLSGERLALARRRVEAHHSRPGFSEYDAEELFAAVGACLGEVTAACLTPLAVGVTSFGESVIPLDAAGKPLGHAIAWFDNRGQPQVDGLLERFSAIELFNATGQYLSPKFTLAKLLWLRENDPRLLEAAHRFAFVQDYVAFRLTGELATEYSLASRSMLFDVSAKAWSPRLLALCGITGSQLPAVLPSGRAVGAVTSEAAAATGLPAGIPVCLAGHDHASATFAAGLGAGQGVALDSLGTSETSMLAAAAAEPAALFRGNLGYYPYREGAAPLRCIASIQACGASIEWMARLLFGGDVFARFFSAAGEALGEGDRPLFLPFLRGLQERPGMLAAFEGLRDTHGRRSLCLAVLEGLCFEHRRRLEDGEGSVGAAFHTVRAAGRLSAQPVFMQRKADILRRRVEVLAEEEAASQGAAMQAGLACGAIGGFAPRFSASYEPAAADEDGRYSRYRACINGARPYSDRT